MSEEEVAELPLVGRYGGMPPVYVFVAPVLVEEDGEVGRGVAVVVCVVVLVTGAPPPEGVTVTITVMTCVVGAMDTEAVEVMVVCEGVITVTVLETPGFHSCYYLCFCVFCSSSWGNRTYIQPKHMQTRQCNIHRRG